MTIKEMHQLFRVIGQQVGMQTIRAILPEEIDVFLNSAINETVRTIVATNVAQGAEGKIIQNANISPINALRNLYTRVVTSVKIDNSDNKFQLAFDNIAMYYTGFSVNYTNNDKLYKARLVEPDELENTLNDYCNGASYDYPIVLYTNGNPSTLTVYSGDKVPYSVICNFIKNPTIVSYDNKVDCDLPKYLHNEIVQLAVQKYFNSVGSTTHNVE